MWVGFVRVIIEVFIGKDVGGRTVSFTRGVVERRLGRRVGIVGR